MTDSTPGLAAVGDLAEKLRTGAEPGMLGTGSLLGNMSGTVIAVNLLAGLVGTAYFMYGRKSCNVKAVGWGIALCVVPYFIGNTFLLIAACIAMAAAPFIL